MKHLRRITLLAIISVAALSTFATPFSESDNFNDIPETSDHQSLWQQYAKEAQNGDTEAQYKLALLYYHGKGIKQNYKEAAYWFRKAGSNGHNKAKFYIASMFADGKGVLQDNRIAAEWYSIATASEWKKTPTKQFSGSKKPLAKTCPKQSSY